MSLTPTSDVKFWDALKVDTCARLSPDHLPLAWHVTVATPTIV